MSCCALNYISNLSYVAFYSLFCLGHCWQCQRISCLFDFLPFKMLIDLIFTIFSVGCRLNANFSSSQIKIKIVANLFGVFAISDLQLFYIRLLFYMCCFKINLFYKFNSYMFRFLYINIIKNVLVKSIKRLKIWKIKTICTFCVPQINENEILSNGNKYEARKRTFFLTKIPIIILIVQQ